MYVVLQDTWYYRTLGLKDKKPHFFMVLKINMWWLLGDAEVTESLQRKHFAVLLAFQSKGQVLLFDSNNVSSYVCTHTLKKDHINV